MRGLSHLNSGPGQAATERWPVYLDNQATTPMDPRVAEVVMDCMLRAYGNASSTEHVVGHEADSIVRTARQEVAAIVGARSANVVFTSGATEATNLAIQGFVRRRLRQKPSERVRVGVMQVEHPAVLEVCRMLARDGLASVVELPVNRHGQIVLEEFDRACRGLDLACVMAANNEIGTVYPLAAIAEITNRCGVALFSDASQAAGKVPIRFDDWGIDLLALSGHKIYGPKGVGALIVSSRDLLDPLFAGGGHEGGLRPGTHNVPGIAGLGEACRLRRAEMGIDEEAIRRKRDRMEGLLFELLPDLAVNGDRENRLAGNLHISIPGIPGSAVVARLRDRVAISTGSACSSGVEGPSHVLRALGLSDDAAEGALRIGVGKFTTDDDVEISGRLIAEAARLVSTALMEART